MVSKTSVSVSALSSALSVMMSSFPAHFSIFDILHHNDKEDVNIMVFHLISLHTVTSSICNCKLVLIYKKRFI